MNCTMNLSIRVVVALVMVSLLSQSATAVTLSYLGLDETTLADWRTTSVTKPAEFDPSGDNAYGTDGYFVFYGADGSLYTGSSATGDEGAMHGPPVAISDLPDYISSVEIDSDINYQVSSYSTFLLDDPSQPIGAAVTNFDKTNWAFATSSANGVYDKFFKITLAQDATFVLNVITGADGAPYYNGANRVRVMSDGVSADSDYITNGSVEHTFFQLSGLQGDTFTVACMANAGVPATTGIGFEVTAPPAPSTATIDYVGYDETTLADWRTTSVVKPAAFDPNGDNAYGTDGYFVFYGTDGSLYTGSPATGDEGAMHGSPVAISDLPDYISSVEIGSSINYQVSSYVNSDLDDPSQPIGADVADFDKTNWAFATTSANGLYDNVFTITLAQDATFMLNVITGTDGAPYYAGATGVMVTSGSVSAKSGDIINANDGNPDHTFFQLSGKQGDTFTVACMSSIDGTVPTVTGIGFEAIINIPGDANNDGKVDGSDVTILAGNWQKGVSDGQTAAWGDGDFNGDGKVDGSDVTILAGNWQTGVTAAATAVPEPSTIALLLGLLATLVTIRRMKK